MELTAYCGYCQPSQSARTYKGDKLHLSCLNYRKSAAYLKVGVKGEKIPNIALGWL